MVSAVERFNDKYVPDPNSGCWLWIGSLNQAGYGQLQVNGRKELAHRFSVNEFQGKQIGSNTVDHLCKNKICVNPNHLEVVTFQENLLRSNGMAAVNQAKTTCDKGHPLDGLRACKTTISGMTRYCKTCANERNAIRYRKNRDVINLKRRLKRLEAKNGF